MSAFFIHSLWYLSYVITARTMNSKSSKEKHTKNLQFFLNARNECKVGKNALTTL